ncbi:MAG: ABC transporter substrate-binding protein [Reyranella sp.]|nr:ABC transporter substrate-binding protein [Reyranella sp.]
MGVISRRLGLVAALAAGLAAAPALAQAPTAAPVKGGTLTIGVESDFEGFDPVKAGVYSNSTVTAASLFYETLMRLDDKGNLLPALALSMTPNADGSVWTAKIRPGVKWHDGTPFTAQAVADHFNRLLDPANRYAGRAYLAIEKVEAPDELTAVFKMRGPNAALPKTLAQPTVTTLIIPVKQALEKGADYNRNPIGTGPFVFKEWRAADRLIAERNPNYWDKDKPYLDRVIVRPLPDSDARYASLVKGDVQVIWEDRAENILKARKDKNLVVLNWVGSGALVIPLNTQREPLNDKRVRQAVSMALNRKANAEVLTQGLRPVHDDPYGPASGITCKDNGALKYNPEAAKKLLADYGKPVKMTMTVTATPRGREGAQVFQADMKKVGIDVEIKPVDQTQLVKETLSRDFQVTGWRIIDLADVDPQMFANFHSKSPINFSGYNNAEVDRLLLIGRTSLDENKRKEAYCDLIKILNDDAVWLWSGSNTDFAITRANVRGIPGLRGGAVQVEAAWLAK